MSSKLNICLVITQPEWGGAQRYVYDLALGLQSHGYAVTVATGAGEKRTLLDRLEKAGIRTHQFALLQRSISLIQDIRAWFELRRFFKQGKFDVVHLNSSKAGVLGACAAKLAGVRRVVFTAHGFVFNEKQSFVRRWLYVFLTWGSGLYTDTVIAVSRYDKESALRYHVYPERKIEVIHNGVDYNTLTFLDRETARLFFASNGVTLKDTTHLVLSIGNLYNNKGFSYVVEAAASVVKDVPDTVYVIMGEGEERTHLEQMIAEKDLTAHVYLIGFVEQPEQYLKAADVYVLSSLKEGLPYSLIEARAAGVPIVATNVGGVPEIVDTGHGALVAREHSRALATQIKTMLTRKSHVADDGYEDMFRLDDMVEQTRAVYEIL